MNHLEGNTSPLEGNTSPQEREFMGFSEKIKEIKKNIEEPLGGILKYSDVGSVAISFFPEGSTHITQKEVDNATIFLDSYLKQFNRLSQEVKESIFLNEVQKNIFIGTLKSYALKIIGFKSAVYIEAEKAGYPLSKIDQQRHLHTIEQIESLVYGPKISEKKEEVGAIMSTLDTLFTKNKEKISEEEQEIFNKFLKKNSERAPKSGAKTIEKPKNRLGDLTQEDFAKTIEKGLKIYNIESKVIKITDTIKKIEEKNGILYIPKNNPENGEEYKREDLDEIYIKYGITKNTIKIKINKCPNIDVNIPGKEINIPSSANYYSTIRALELISHEIVTHAFSGVNKERKFNVEADTYLELQEGVAMLNEKAVSGKIEDISSEPTIHHISTFIGENYNAAETQKLLEIYYKLNGKKNAATLAKNRTERVKRFHANDEKGASRKDVVYWRGMLDVLEYIQSLDPKKEADIKALQENIFGFYIGKLGKSEVQNAKELIEGFDINSQNIILPADIGKILLWMLEKETPEGKGISITKDKLGEQDIRFKASHKEQELSYSQRKLLLEMRSFIDESKKRAKTKKEREAIIKAEKEKEKEKEKEDEISNTVK